MVAKIRFWSFEETRREGGMLGHQRGVPWLYIKSGDRLYFSATCGTTWFLGFTKTPSIMFYVQDNLQRPFLKELKEQLGSRTSGLLTSPIGQMLLDASFRFEDRTAVVFLGPEEGTAGDATRGGASTTSAVYVLTHVSTGTSFF